MKENITTSARYLADLCLEAPQEHQNYTEKDMENATLIFMHFFTDLMYTHHKDKLTEEQMLMLAEEAGKSIRQTLILFTGLDMREIVKK